MNFRKIILIEDNKALGTATKALLEEHDFDVSLAFDADGASEILENYIPDIILCDIMMPGLDGYQFLQRVKSNEKFLFTPFIFLTAKSSPEDRLKGLRLGADDYITKPFNINTLIQSINLKIAQKSAIDKFRLQSRQTAFVHEIFAKASHEFNTPLSNIAGCLNYLMDQNSDLNKEERLQTFSLMKYSITRLNHSLNNAILAYSLKYKENSFNLTGSSSVPQLLRDVLKDLSEIYGDHFRLMISDENLTCSIFHEYARIIFYECLENSFKFSYPESLVLIRIKKIKSVVCIEITNQVKNQDQAPTHLLQAENQGLGLGLLIASDLLKKANGVLKTERKNGQFICKIKIPILI